MNRMEIVTMINFMKDEMTEEMVTRLIDTIRGMSLEDKFYIMDYIYGGPVYTELSMHLAEIGYPY